MTRAATALTIAALLTVACGSSPTAPSTSTEPQDTISTHVFAGTLDARGAEFYSFTVVATGGVKIMLASVTSPPARDALTTTLGLGIGQPAGTGCAMTDSIETRAALTAQIVTTLEPGIYCANVYDPATLVIPVNFIVRIIHF